VCDVERLRDTVRAVDTRVFSQVRTMAQQAFHDFPLVSKLADEHGGWSEADLAALTGAERWEMQLLDTVLIYSTLATPGELSGLGHHWATLQARLADSWKTEDTDLLIVGRQIEDFLVQEGVYTASSVPAHWHHLKPLSTASTLGFLSLDDIRRLHTLLNEHAGSQSNPETAPVQLALEMLTFALAHHSVLCLIASG
jgi:hypothetical protein